MPKAIDEILESQCGPEKGAETSTRSSTSSTPADEPPLTLEEVGRAADESMELARDFFSMLGGFHRKVSEKLGGGRGGPLPR
jgi:hypothetical protein